MKRIYTNQILWAFIPSSILWLYGYSTLFISHTRHIDRFRGTGTALLAVVMLLNVINSNLPSTSYVKYIDLWFLWHVASIFFMIIYHILIGRLHTYSEDPKGDKCAPINMNKSMSQIRKQRIVRSAKKNNKNIISTIDKLFIFIFPILSSLFYAIYFCATLN